MSELVDLPQAVGVRPSLCESCVPVVRLVSDGYFLAITETAHETDCRNHPKNIQGHSAEVIG